MSTQNAAELTFDASGSPIYVNGEKRYFSSRIYTAKGLLKSDSEKQIPAHVNIGFFGDSYTEGLQVDEPFTFTSLTEKTLRQQGLRVNIFNFAVSGTGTYHQYLRYKTIAEQIPLQHIVVFFLPQNDVLNNRPILGKKFELPGAPYMGDVNMTGNYKIKDSSSLLKSVAKNLFLARYIIYFYRTYLDGQIAREREPNKERHIDAKTYGGFRWMGKRE